MNKKLNYLAVIPVFGTVILLFWLFIKLIKNEIAKKSIMLISYVADWLVVCR